MKLYKITASTRPDGDAHQVRWVGSQADAASQRKTFVAKGFCRAEIETDEADIPTDKAGLLAWLNANV